MVTRDLTQGSIVGNIARFSIPYIISYFLQILYGLADLYIIGQFRGVESITAVSIGSQVMHMLTVMIVGLAMGTTVSLAKSIGMGDTPKGRAVIGNTVTLFLGISIVLASVLLCCTRNIVSAMSTPAEAVSETISYLRICFIGIPFIVAYNIIASIFRGMGDSQSPTYFIAIACAVNIAMDYIFIGKMNMGAVGAALGTTLSQAASVLVSLIVMTRSKSGIRISGKDLRPDGRTMQEVVKIGVPVSLQDGFIQISFIVITIIANRRGLDDAAAVGIVEKIIGVLFLVPSAMLSTVSAISAQNIGAGKPDRARKTLMDAVFIAASFGLVSATAMQFLSGDAVGLFTGDERVRLLGGQYLRSYIWDCVFAGIHFCFSGYFCACGHSIISFIHNFLSIVLARIPLAWFASANWPDTLFPMGLAAPVGSSLSVIICIGAHLWLRKKELYARGVSDGHKTD